MTADAAKSYKEVLAGKSLYSAENIKPVAFFNVCGDETPELFLLTGTQYSPAFQVWSFQKGSVSEVLSLPSIGYENSSDSFFAMDDGRLCRFRTWTGYVISYSCGRE